MRGVPKQRFVWKFAWQDLRAHRGRSALIVIALALSISGIGGVRSAADAALASIERGSRASLAGDICVETGQAISAEQIAALDAMRKEGIDWTLVTILLTMASSDQSADPVFVAVKAIDPAVYPFYGASLAAGLRGDGVSVSRGALRRLHVRVGDRIRIGRGSFRISGVTKAEPEQVMGILDRGPRAILSRENFVRSGIARGGSSSVNRILLRLPRGFDLGAARERLQALVPEGTVFDYRDTNQNAGLHIESVETSLTETALLALALGSLGIAVAVRQLVEQRVETFALMKTLGARNGQLTAILLAEIALLAGAALPVGIALGWIVKSSLLSMAGNYLILQGASGGNGVLLLEAAAAAILATVPAAAGPIWMLCRLRPATVLRNEGAQLDSPGRALILAMALALFGLFGAIAWQVLGSAGAAFGFTAALFAGALFSFGVSRFGLRVLAMVKHLPPVMRLGLGNLTRAGNHQALLVAVISAGAMMMVGSAASSSAVIRAADAKLPYDLSNSVLIAGFDDSQGQRVRSIAQSVGGVENVEMRTEILLLLTAVDGVPVKSRGLWYAAGCSAQGLTLDRAMELGLGASPGSRLDFQVARQKLSAVVSAIVERKFSYPIQVDCGGMDAANLFHEAVVRARPGELQAVDDALRGRFPGLAVITAPEIENVVLDISSDAQSLARIVSWYSVAVGLAIMMALVSGSRAQRLRETGILSALGAAPKTLAAIYTIEFLSAGALAGWIGTAAAFGFGSVLLRLVFQRWEFAFGWPMAAAIPCAALLTAAAGWIPTWRLLRQKPMNVLRGL